MASETHDNSSKSSSSAFAGRASASRPEAPLFAGKAAIEAAVAKLWQEVLGLPSVGKDDNFFDLGGTSLLATLLLSKLNQTFAQNLLVATVFEYPTVRSMADFLDKVARAKQTTESTTSPEATKDSRTASGVAIIGMSGRFPGADTVENFWENLCAGVESITFFERDQLETRERLGELPPNYVAARPIINDADMFDADFFGIYPKEAEQMDPQHRVFLECAWETLERAGYDPSHTKDSVGVFAGCSMNTYFMQNIVTGRRFLEDFTAGYQVGSYVTMMGNDKDFLPTRVSYKLNLHGPSIAVQSACSTSLVAVSQACQSLLTNGCDMALAGAVSITFPQHRGYTPQEGGLASHDGHCRPFDHRASGTIFGHGCAVLLLKRLEDAVADGDQVLAVIRGFAINNDGSAKVGYTAPGVDGQAEVITRAQKMAGVSAETITYLEAHGTATPLGDPIEVAALTKAFSRTTQATQFCAIGTAKANVGHLDVAAGATGLIKTVLQLEHRTIPRLLHFEQPNPHLDLGRSPFFVPRETRAWQSENGPLRAGVSAFGIGGTNAHVIVEEAPATEPSDQGRDQQLLVWSAKTPTALVTVTEKLRRHLANNPDAKLADMAYTLQVGRTPQRHRSALVADSVSSAIAALSDAKAAAIVREDKPFASPNIVFCFPGQGVQMLSMGRRLYETEPVFRQALDTCSEKLQPWLGESLLEILYPAEATPEAAARLNDTVHAQPAIFAFEYALAQLWLSWGIRPDAMVGHSVGEYVAMCLAEVLSLDDALHMIAVRGRLMQDLPRGSMLAVRAPEAKVLELAGDALDLAAVNGPQLCVVSGPDSAIDAFMQKLDGEKITCRRLVTSHAFHSRMVEPALAPFNQFVRGVSFSEPKIPCVSTLTGNWITAKDVSDPSYWTRQLRQAVRFADAIRELATTPERIFLEVGPAETLVQLVRQTVGKASGAQATLASLASSRDGVAEDKAILSALGRLWTLGAVPDWSKFHSAFHRKRVLLPTYPFERKKYWISPPQEQTASQPVLAMISPPLEGPRREVTSSSYEDLKMATPVADSATILNELKYLITDLSGVDLTDADPGSSFFELGFDSLFLTQLTQGIHGKYKIKMTFRQVMENYPTLETLAAYLDETVPQELRAVQPPAAAPLAAAPVAAAPAIAAPIQTVPVATAVAPLNVAAPTGSLEALFAAQTQALSNLFQQQIAALHGQPVAVSAPLPQPVALPVVPAVAASVPALAATPVVAAAPASAPQQSVAEAKPAKPVFIPFKPLQRGTETGLNVVQQKYLQNLTQKYTQRSASSKSFTQAHRSVFADGRVVSGFNAQIKELIYPLVVERSSGAYLWDKDGNRYIDILNGFGAIFFGHSPEWLLEAVRKQLELGFPIGPQTELAGECAELISELTGMERVTFCNTGSEAVMGAMRLARTVTGRNLIVMFSGDYHGSFDEVLVKAVGGHRSMPVAPGIPRESVANTLVLDYGTPESLEIIRQRAGEIAAVLVEPVQSRHPELRPSEFLHEVRRITEQNGAALIFDEVVTGFRTHPGGMQAVYGIRADLATYGKVVAGGLPVGVLTGRPEYMNALDGGMWQYGDNSFPEAGVTFYAGTFMRHPLALAAVRASMLHVKEMGPTLQSALADKTAALVRDLQGMFKDFSHPSALETYSSWFYFSVPGEPFLTRLLHFHLREQGVHIQEGFPCFLTTAHTDSDLDFVREAFHSSFRQMRDGQALPNSVVDVPAGSAPVVDVPATASASPEAVSGEQAEMEEGQLPITEEQREILLGTQLGDEANCSFNESTSLTLQGELNESALCDALQQLVNRHDALRLTFDEQGDFANVLPSLVLEIEREDLSSLSLAEQTAQLALLFQRDGSTPFDLIDGPLVRTKLVRLGAREHRLILTAHHIIFDGWSTNVFYSELSDLYNAAVAGSKASLPSPLSFSRYSLQRTQTAQSRDQVSVEAYWLGQFKTQPSPLQIPTDRPRPEMRGHKGKSSRFVLDRELFTAVRKAGARQGCTLFATLLASSALLMHRLAGQDDLVLGIPMAGQSKAENGSTLVGHCVNFLPIRSRMQPDVTLSQFLKQTRNTLLDAYDNQDYTYGTLLRKLKMHRDPSRLQLIEVQFNVEQVGAELKFANLIVDLQANPKTHVNMDIFFNFVDRGTELWLDCDYNTDLFDDSTIERWFGHLEAILRAFTENGEQPCTQASLLTPQQEQEVLVLWNQTSTDYPRKASIPRVFEERAKSTPNAIAVIAEQHTLTYAELNEKANQLARFLVHSGITPGSTVALSLYRSAESIVSLLAILKTGAAYVPIDPSYPAPRVSYLVSDSAAKALLTTRAIAERLPQLDTNIICLDADWPAIAVEDTHNLSQENGGDDLAYIMYTSGSTGNPKGVLVPHRAVLRLVLNNSFASFGSGETFLQLAPLSFDASTFEIWGALLNGGRLVIGPAERVTPEEIGRIIQERGVTTLWLTAAFFHLIVTEHLEILRPLRQLLAGGDSLSLTHVTHVCEQLPQLRLINGYGPTENTTFTCCHPITSESLSSGTVPIGRPIANTRIYILDAQMKPVPVGVAGELYAAGDGLALGYLNAPELTAEKFVNHTFANGVSERLYRTGDLARYRPDGTVEFQGRIDTQVKVRGYRIELAEIEYVLEQSPKVRSAVVAVRTDWVSPNDAPGDKRLVAYIIPAQPGDEATLIQELRQQLQEQLPDYMRPAAIMAVESFPRTLNGKIDRRSLPAPVPEQLIRQRAIVSPRNENEATLASIWEKVLGLKEISVDDSIFEVGGDSLLIFRITTMANQVGLNITARHFFQYKTIAEICGQLVQSGNETASSGVGAIQAIPRSQRRRKLPTLQ